jgi:hypothetical protein
MMPPSAGSAGFYRGTGVRNLAKVDGKDTTQCGCCGRSRADVGSLMKCGRCIETGFVLQCRLPKGRLEVPQAGLQVDDKCACRLC